MKKQLFILLGLIFLILQISISSSVNAQEFIEVYDPDVDIQSGDKINWIVVKNEKNNKTVNYGISTEEPLKITMEVLTDIGGSDLKSANWDQYFQTNLTVGGELVTGTLYEYLDRFRSLEFTWIERTLFINETTEINKFTYRVDLSPHYTTNADLGKHNITQQIDETIDGDFFILNKDVFQIRSNDSVKEYIDSRTFKYDIHNGILQSVSHSIVDQLDDDADNWMNLHYVIELDSFEHQEGETNLLPFSISSSIFAPLIVVIAVYKVSKKHQ